MPDSYSSLLGGNLPKLAETHPHWGRLYGASLSLAIAELTRKRRGLVLLLTPDSHTADTLEHEIRFFLAQKGDQLLHLPDWETLPYDLFSPHEDIISSRLEILHRLPSLKSGLLILPVSTLLQRLAPVDYIQGTGFDLKTGDLMDLPEFRRQLESAGYHAVTQVISHGEFALRGSLVDVFPMGATLPFRVDLFDDEIESIRSFDPETQKSIEKLNAINLLPAHEFPLDAEGIKAFLCVLEEKQMS